MAQPYSFSFTESLIAENAGVTLKSMHFDVDAILKAYDGIQSLAGELAESVPKPRLAGFGYPHVASLGAPVRFPDDGEPNVSPIIEKPEDIDTLEEPQDYLASPLLQDRLKLAADLGRLHPGSAHKSIGHSFEGPITTAVLLMGQDFFMLVYDDPERAHRLLSFCTESALHYSEALHRHFYGNDPVEPGPRGIPDDFAGMLRPELFAEFVIPYWNRLYDGMGTAERHLHSELLREEHLPFLKDLEISYFDPSADQYLTPELLAVKCPCRFMSRILSWEIQNLAAENLEKLYIDKSRCKPYLISFSMNRMNEIDKIKRLLKLAKNMEQ